MTDPSDKQPTDLELHCLECDYNLTGVRAARCPWCGTPIDLPAIIAQADAPPSMMRFGVIAASLFVGLGSIAIVITLTRNHGVRQITEGVAMLGMLGASAGLLWLGVLAIHTGRRWPIRNAEARSLLRLAGWISVTAGLIGAANMLECSVDPKLVRGVQVYSGFEYVLAAFAFTFPGWALLMLRYVSFREDPPRGADGAPIAPHLPVAPPFEVVFARRYCADQVVVLPCDERRRTTPQIEAHVAREWEAEQALAEQGDKTLFNGPLGRLVRSEAGPDQLELHVGKTTYREFLGTHAHPVPTGHAAPGPQELSGTGSQPGCSDRPGPQELCGTGFQPVSSGRPRPQIPTTPHESGTPETQTTVEDPYRANPLGISAIVITADDAIVLGRRSQRVALHAGYLHTFGGMLENEDRLPDGSYDVFACAIRELCEELPIKPAEIAHLLITGMVHDTNLAQPELLFDARLTVPLDVLQDRFETASLDFEHDVLEWIRDDPAILPAFIVHARPIAPIAEAAILLHGRHRWGEPWYDSCNSELYP